MVFFIKDILSYLEAQKYTFTYVGDSTVRIKGYSSFDNYKEGTITWVKNDEKLKNVAMQNVTLLIAPENIRTKAQSCIYCKNPKSCFFSILDNLLDVHDQGAHIGVGTYISDEVQIGNNVWIGANCVLDGDIEIGDNTRIENGVVVCNHVTIGKNCTIQSLTVIGEDGFGYFEHTDGIRHMIRHHGGVVIGDNVFIGSHVNIARGTLDDTVIGDNVKIAPSTHIGHNNQIEKDAVIICSRIYGSCHIGENAYLTACTVKNQTTVGKYSLVGMGAVVIRDVEENKVMMGIPARVYKDREQADCLDECTKKEETSE